jgi:hypothetical protein
LASRVDELNEVWNDRHAPTNALPHLFPASVVGCVDSFPIFCSRPTDSFYQSSTYNGKYGGNVLKVQAVCDHSGAFLWYSGPHLGTTHDLTLYRQHPPELDNGDQLLADLAYIGGREHAATLVTPFKKRMVRRLNRRNGKVKIRALPLPPNQALYNRVHSWYRATIEHAFGYVKRYRIINSTYRGRLHQHPEYLKRAVRIIMHLSNIHLREHPHRRHIPLIAGNIALSNINFNALEVRAWSDNDGTGHDVDDFWVGQRVEVRLPHGEWLQGMVRHRNPTRNSISVLLAGAANGDLIRVDPRLVRHISE